MRPPRICGSAEAGASATAEATRPSVMRGLVGGADGYLLKFGPDVEVLAPAELRAKVREKLRAAGRRYMK